MGANLADARNRLADPVGQEAHHAHALLGELVHRALQPGDDDELHRVERDGGEPDHRALVYEEPEDHEQRSALEHRQGEGIADESAKRLDLVVDHVDDHARRLLPEGRQREAQYPGIEVVAQPAQHALAREPARHVDDVLEPLVDEDQHQEAGAEKRQILNLGEMEAENLDRKGDLLALDRAVHDFLGQLVEHVEERERHDRHHGQDDLLTRAVIQDVTVQARFHVRAAPGPSSAPAGASPTLLRHGKGLPQIPNFRAPAGRAGYRRRNPCTNTLNRGFRPLGLVCHILPNMQSRARKSRWGA